MYMHIRINALYVLVLRGRVVRNMCSMVCVLHNTCLSNTVTLCFCTFTEPGLKVLGGGAQLNCAAAC